MQTERKWVVVREEGNEKIGFVRFTGKCVVVTDTSLKGARTFSDLRAAQGMAWELNRRAYSDAVWKAFEI